MSDQQRLRDKLGKLSAGTAATDNAPRSLQPNGKKGWLESVLQEIDETILSRRLTFERADGAFLVFEITNRRLLRLREISGQADSSEFSDLVNMPLADEDADHLDDLANLLGTFLKNTDTLLVRSEKLNRETDPSEVGCSVEGLAKLWSISLYSSSEFELDDRVDGFVADCQELALAWAKTEPDQSGGNSGAAENVAKLVELAGADLSNADKALADCFAPNQHPNCILIGNDNANRMAIVSIETGRTKVFCLLNSSDVSDVLKAWQDVC